VAVRRHMLPNDGLYALQVALPHLTRSAPHRCLKRHGVGLLPEVEGDNRPKKHNFKHHPMDSLHRPSLMFSIASAVHAASSTGLLRSTVPGPMAKWNARTKR
jgi:hypothetical protein